MIKTVDLLPPVLRTERGRAWGAAVDGAFALDPWQACPLKVEHAAEEVLWSLARQFGVAGPLMQAMKTRQQRENLIKRALLLQKKRGTPWATEEIMRLLGYADAEVLDRATALVYNAEIIHDGGYLFDGGRGEVVLRRYGGGSDHDGSYPWDGILSKEPGHWRHYRIRLHIDGESRAFGLIDRAEALMLANSWAPARSILVGWNARHVFASKASDPAEYARQAWRVVLMDNKLNSHFVRNHWLQFFEDGSVAVRWRIRPEDMTVAEVASVALVKMDGSELERKAAPLVSTAENVIYEGFWRMAL